MGDYLDWVSKGDILSFADTPAVLEVARNATTESYAVERPWQRLTSIGEFKVEAQREKGQLFGYLCALKGYRPDMATVHGFQFERNHLLLYSLNACGCTQSDRLKYDDLNAWVAHVALVYNAHASRDRRLQLVEDQESFVRWQLTMNERTIDLAPFNARGVPGRATWTAFQLQQNTSGPQTPEKTSLARAYVEEAPIGFVKVSWQNTASKFTEGRLLDHAHRTGWIPGLVRHIAYHREVYDANVSLDDQPNVVRAVDVDTKGQQLTRVKEIVWLASVGQPLSQCEDLEHLLMVGYDALEGV